MTATRQAACLLLLGCIVATAPTAAPGADLHAYWDDRCAACHGDSGPFARATLRVVDGRLAGPHHGTAVDGFLRSHHLAPELHAPVVAMLIAQATTPPLYSTHCAGCHGPAAVLVRESLRWDGTQWVSRRRGQPLERLLASHGGASAADVHVLARTLRRVAEEVGLPGGPSAP